MEYENWFPTPERQVNPGKLKLLVAIIVGTLLALAVVALLVPSVLQVFGQVAFGLGAGVAFGLAAKYAFSGMPREPVESWSTRRKEK